MLLRSKNGILFAHYILYRFYHCIWCLVFDWYLSITIGFIIVLLFIVVSFDIIIIEKDYGSNSWMIIQGMIFRCFEYYLHKILQYLFFCWKFLSIVLWLSQYSTMVTVDITDHFSLNIAIFINQIIRINNLYGSAME